MESFNGGEEGNSPSAHKEAHVNEYHNTKALKDCLCIQSKSDNGHGDNNFEKN